MARIVITTWGTTGDLNPYVPIGQGLRDRGHDVLFAVEERFEAPLHAVGLQTSRLASDCMRALQHYRRDIFETESPVILGRTFITKIVGPLLPTSIAGLRSACAGADLLVSAAGQLAAGFVADLTGIAWATVSHVPFDDPTDSTEINSLLNALRASYSLPPRDGYPGAGLLSPACTLALAPPGIMRPWSRWASSHHMTGFCFWDGAETWTEPPELTAFLAERTPAVALCGGSTSMEIGGHLEAFFRAGVAAIRRVGARALVFGAPAGVLADLPEGVLALPFAPFSRVFPRCAAVIHHGGIGTTALALRAGVPALIVPWGVVVGNVAARVVELAVARRVPREEFTADRATAELRGLLADDAMRARVRELAARIQEEDGVKNACDVLEAFLATASGPAPAGKLAKP
jgi:rhamnosyltransferase subunit B